MDMFSNVTESFSNNLIVEDRYRMILDGLQVTLLITLFAAVLGADTVRPGGLYAHDGRRRCSVRLPTFAPVTLNSSNAWSISSRLTNSPTSC